MAILALTTLSVVSRKFTLDFVDCVILVLISFVCFFFQLSIDRKTTRTLLTQTERTTEYRVEQQTNRPPDSRQRRRQTNDERLAHLSSSGRTVCRLIRPFISLIDCPSVRSPLQYVCLFDHLIVYTDKCVYFEHYTKPKKKIGRAQREIESERNNNPK